MPSVSAQYSIVLRVEIDHRPGMLGRVATAIGDAGGSIGSIDLVAIEHGHTLRNITIETAGEEHASQIGDAVDQVDGARTVDITDRTFQMHVGGKIEQRNKLPVKTRDDLSMAYTPGVARVCMAIAQDRDRAFQYTIKRNTVAVVSDGSAVLGLGDIGPEAAMPVMEGKAVLFKEFGGVDAFPICLSTKDPDEIVQTVTHIAPAFGGINLEDISAPRCFEIEERLKATLDIPVFHDDQHGTAVVTLAALINAAKLTNKDLDEPQGPDRRPRRGRDRDGEDLPARRRHRHRRLRQPRRRPHRPRRLPGRQHAADQALVRRGHQPREARRQPRRRDRGRRPVRRPLRRPRDGAGRPADG